MALSNSVIGILVISTALISAQAADGPLELPLPAGVKAVWDTDKAFHETTPTRERICLNGLWAWQPGKADADAAPVKGWGAFKVPGAWPGRGDYMMKDSQTVFREATWKDVNLSNVSAAWYQRDFSVPKQWTGRTIALHADYLNSFATVFIDGKVTGHLYFPGGELDITSVCTPGEKHVLTLLVVAIPLNTVMKSYSDSNAPKDVKDVQVALRGLCGDVFVSGTPAGAAVEDVKINTSVRKGELSLDATVLRLDPAAAYSLRVQISDKDRVVKEFTSKPFKGTDAKDGHIATVEKWRAEKLWDLNTPQNMYQLQLALLDSTGKVLDTLAPVRFAFREFWIDGRDFYLNGSRIFLSSVPLDNASSSVASSTYEAAKESMLRLKTFGMNFLYTHNYGCEPGTHLQFEELLRAADDVGMLIGLSQPHFGQYTWDKPDSDQANGYARHAEFYCRVAGNHPSVICYSMSHNGCGYADDMNPDCIDGIFNERAPWSLNNSKLALRCEAIVSRLDPSRFVYHHSGGNLGTMHTTNFYPNWAPIQELSDWFEHWATKGVKPVFLCEYGAPFTWDFAMYRGYYGIGKDGKPIRNFGSAQAPWELCVAEWESQFYGDRAFKISELEKNALRFESQKIKAGTLDWFRWDYPRDCMGSSVMSERMPIFGMYYADTFRAYRTWGVSATSPWEQHVLFDLRPGVDKGHKELKVDWENLQRPGYSPDFIDQRVERMDMAFERADWIPNAAGQALLRNNMPLLAYIAGKPAAFTSKDHIFLPGESIEKQLIIINNSRETSACDCSWSLNLPKPVAGSKTVSVKTGEQERIPLRFDVPADTPPGAYEISASVKFGNGDTQKDTFAIHVLPKLQAVRTSAKIALFDPKGETAKWLSALGVTTQAVNATAELSGFDTLIVGKAALSVDGAAPDISRVRDGLKVILFEQEPEVLEKRFGFRVQEYGLRTVFKRTPDHSILAGIDAEDLRDWRGEATIVPPRRALTPSDNLHGEGAIRWCGIEVARVWRCGNRGNVASVIIEKPACGDFLPLLDGGFSLQYSPLLEYREGKGMVLFCQVDLTGRTEAEPAADALGRNMLNYVSAWKPAPARKVVYAGEPAGKTHLEKSGLDVTAYSGAPLTPAQILVAGPGSGAALNPHAEELAAWLKSGGKILALGLDESEANAILPFKVSMKKTEHIAAYFDPPALNSGLAGVGPADIHNRDPRELPLLNGGATLFGDGVLAKADGADAVFSQLVPWRFEYKIPQNIKRTFRRASFTLTRLLSNMGASFSTPLMTRFHTGADAKTEKRWQTGFYLDQPEEWDDPYRFFRW